MSNITKAWQDARICYQQRYVSFARKYKKNSEDKELLGHLNECSYVLIEFFGLTPNQVKELEENDFMGLTHQDLKK